MSEPQQKTLLPDRHPTRDFFVADIFDSLPFKDDMASMSYPIFSLSKKKDTRNLEYQNGDVSISIKPNTDGLPTIFDKDVLLYCGSLLMNEINEGRIPPKTLRISSHDLLVATNRPTNGQGYSLLKKGLDRLRGVTIKTNIKTNKREVTRAFGLIESYEIIESSRFKDRMIRLEITLSDWFYNSILGREVLTISRDYFRLRKPLERRLYEIARKHCGRSPDWSIGLEKLKDRVGSTSSLPKFRFFINQQVKCDHLPDYQVALSASDIVTFKRRAAAPLLDLEDMPRIKPETIDKGEKIVREAGTGWDYREIRSQFTQQLMNGFSPDNADGAFIAFVKKKAAERP
jgi:plasmid replication initiation protein